MRIEEILKKDLGILKLDKKLNNKLNNIDIVYIGDLWNCKSSYLKENNFSNNDIYQIKIKLQLIGLDLNKKILK